MKNVENGIYDNILHTLGPLYHGEGNQNIIMHSAVENHVWNAISSNIYWNIYTNITENIEDLFPLQQTKKSISPQTKATIVNQIKNQL